MNIGYDHVYARNRINEKCYYSYFKGAEIKQDDNNRIYDIVHYRFYAFIGNKIIFK